MKRNLLAVGLFIVILGLTGIAGAISYTDEWAPGGGSSYTQTGGRVSGIFNFTDRGFDPTTQTIASATLTLALRNSANKSRSLQFEFTDLKVGRNIYVFSVKIGNKTITISAVARLYRNGILKVTLRSVPRRFILEGGTITARATNPVPEPSTVMLLGSGLLGLGIWRRMTGMRSQQLPPC